MPMIVRNKDRLLRKLGKLAPAAFEELAKANRQTADEMADLAKQFAPVRTGKLRDSIVVTGPGGTPPDYSQGGGDVVPEGSFAVSAGNSAVRYPHLAEYGTKAHVNAGIFLGTDNPGAPATPFFWPAYRIVRRKMLARARKAIKTSIEKVAGGS